MGLRASLIWEHVAPGFTKRASRWIQCDALGSVLLGDLGSCRKNCIFGVTSDDTDEEKKSKKIKKAAQQGDDWSHTTLTLTGPCIGLDTAAPCTHDVAQYTMQEEILFISDQIV